MFLSLKPNTNARNKIRSLTIAAGTCAPNHGFMRCEVSTTGTNTGLTLVLGSISQLHITSIDLFLQLTTLLSSSLQRFVFKKAAARRITPTIVSPLQRMLIRGRGDVLPSHMQSLWRFHRRSLKEKTRSDKIFSPKSWLSVPPICVQSFCLFIKSREPAPSNAKGLWERSRQHREARKSI